MENAFRIFFLIYWNTAGIVLEILTRTKRPSSFTSKDSTTPIGMEWLWYASTMGFFL